MKIFAYCDQRYQVATRMVVGPAATLMTSPPIFAGDFNPAWWSDADFIYIDLHGQANSVYLYSGPEQSWAALKLEGIRMLASHRPAIFLTSCYLDRTAFVPAFLQAGAEAVIGGAGENYATRMRVSGAQLLAMLLIRRLQAGLPVEKALEEARARMRFSLQRLVDREATRDALQFKIWR